MAYSTEDEQLDAVKRWLRTHLLTIVAGVVLIVGIVWGRAYWQNSQQSSAEAVYVAFEATDKLRKTFTSAKSDQQDKALQDYSEAVQSLKAEHPEQMMTALALLKFAADLIEQEQWQAAQKELEWLYGKDLDEELHALAALRLGQVLYQRDEHQRALAIIHATLEEGNAYQARLSELQGDILLALDKTNQARKAYTEAQQSSRLLGLNNPILAWKLDDLARPEKTSKVDSKSKAVKSTEPTATTEPQAVVEPAPTSSNNTNSSGKKPVTSARSTEQAVVKQ